MYIFQSWSDWHRFDKLRDDVKATMILQCLQMTATTGESFFNTVRDWRSARANAPANAIPTLEELQARASVIEEKDFVMMVSFGFITCCIVGCISAAGESSRRVLGLSVAKKAKCCPLARQLEGSTDADTSASA